MRYKLVLRKFTQQDITPKCPYFYENDDFDMYYEAFIEDIKAIDGVLDAKVNDDTVILTTERLTQKVVEEKLEPFLNQYFCHLRLVSIGNYLK